MRLGLAVKPAILRSLCHDATAWPILPSSSHVPQRLLGTDLKVICTLAQLLNRHAKKKSYSMRVCVLSFFKHLLLQRNRTDVA